MKKIRFYSQLILLSFFTLTPIIVSATGGAGPGGGDDISIEFSNIANNLPAIIAAKGINYFPEVNINVLKNFVKNPSNFKVEVKENLSVNGAPKKALNYPKMGLIQVSEIAWLEFNKMPDGPLRKNSLVFHEILGLMRLEGNDDYHISQRLYQFKYILNVSSPVVTVGELVSSNYESDEAIIVLVLENKNRVFQYCENRNDYKTCKMLGVREYGEGELLELADELCKSASFWKKVTWIVPGGIVASAVGLTLLAGTSEAIFPLFIIGSLIGAPSTMLTLSQAHDAANRVASLDTNAIKGKTAISKQNLRISAKMLQESLITLK